MKLKLSQTQIDEIIFPFFKDINDNKFQVCLTKGGNLAMLFNRSAGGYAPILGAYFTSDVVSDGEWVPCKWESNGRFPSINTKVRSSKLDLLLDSSSLLTNKDIA